jgi:TRAP-type transport system small permease protein
MARKPSMVQALEKFEERLSKVLLLATVLLVFLASLARWIGHPIVWSVDIAQLLFVWVCFLGANQALRRGEHIGVDFVVRYLPKRIQKAINAFHHFLIMLFLGTIVWFGIDLTKLNVERRFSDTDLSYAWVTAAVPVGSFLLLVTLIRQIRLFRSKNTDPSGPADGSEV